MSSRSSYLSRIASLFAATALLALTTGCATGINSTESLSPIAGLSGVAHGGVGPISGATVTLYATTTAAYGTGGAVLATTTTNASGAFTFLNAATCPTGQQAYVAVSGGDSGAGTNSNLLLLSALGPCASLSTATRIAVNELTTVVAGYALSNFIGVTNSGTTVNISAPATNNATTPVCTGTGSAQTCSASGLAHAFLNALNLANSVSPDGSSTPKGTAYLNIPGNTNSTVPALLINTLSDILFSCVQTPGGVAGDGSACGKFFADTTPPATYKASPPSPNDTLSAIVNLAKFPTMTPAQITDLYTLVSPQGAFVPALSTSPADYSMALVYHGPNTATNYVYAFYSSGDYADNVYTLSEIGNGSGAVTLNQIASNGTAGKASVTITGLLCTAGSPCVSAADTLGNLWVANTNGTTLQVYQITAATGVVAGTFALPTGTAPNSVAVDRNNTVYVTSANATASNVYSKAFNANAFSTLTVGGAPLLETVASPEYITVDNAGNLWNTNYNSTSSNLSYIQNTGTISAPAFANPYVPITLSTTTTQTYTVMTDTTGTAWANNLTTLFSVGSGQSVNNPLTISGTGGAGAVVAATGARFSFIDGDNNIFLPDNSKNSVWVFYHLTGNFTYLSPCTGNTGSTCLTSGLKVAAPRNAFADATGSIWVTDPSATVANGNMVQIIGTAAPTWAQLSYGRAGARP
jgi:hypothetical protein